MLCILCLTGSAQVIHIFEEQGINLDVSGVIVKHFWIQPNKEDANSKVICCSCWNVVDSFHKFYEKVTAAHIKLLSAATSIPREENLKEEESDDDHFDAYTDFVSAGVKQELKEYGAVTFPEADPFTDVEGGLVNIKKAADIDTKSDSDSDSEIPLADLAKRRISTTKDSPFNSDYTNDEDDDDSDYETNKKKVKAKGAPSNCSDYKLKAPSKKVRKTRNSQKNIKSENEQSRAKRKTMDPVKKRELSKEFDDVIEKNIKLACSICHVPLANFFLLRKHYYSLHNEHGYATCCGRKFRKRGVLVDHIYLHLNPEYFKCDKCERILADRRSLEVHMNTHDTSKQRIYNCEDCNKNFYRKLLLDRHMYTHIQDRKFTCEDCQKLFSSDYTLRQHINNVHNSAYNKICDQCGKSIRGVESFRRHQLEHSGVAVPLVQCEKCGVKLASKYGLKRHMDSLHPKSKVLHECKVCGKTAPSLAALQRHTSYMHKCERNHKCLMCQKAFKKPGGLKEHMSTHTGEVLYTCPHCPKTFNSNANMHSHRKKMHRKEWEENRRHPHMAAGSNAD